MRRALAYIHNPYRQYKNLGLGMLGVYLTYVGITDKFLSLSFQCETEYLVHIVRGTTPEDVINYDVAFTITPSTIYTSIAGPDIFAGCGNLHTGAVYA